MAVLLTPRHDGYRPWDTTMVSVRGTLGLQAHEVDSMVAFWNRAANAVGRGSAEFTQRAILMAARATPRTYRHP